MITKKLLQEPPPAPPKGWDSWLDYAIVTMDTRDLVCASEKNWGRKVSRAEMWMAAMIELRELRAPRR